MSKVKDIEGNIELKRRLIFIDGMANTLLNQMKDIKSESEYCSTNNARVVAKGCDADIGGGNNTLAVDLGVYLGNNEIQKERALIGNTAADA